MKLGCKLHLFKPRGSHSIAKTQMLSLVSIAIIIVNVNVVSGGDCNGIDRSLPCLRLSELEINQSSYADPTQNSKGEYSARLQ